MWEESTVLAAHTNLPTPMYSDTTARFRRGRAGPSVPKVYQWVVALGLQRRVVGGFVSCTHFSNLRRMSGWECRMKTLDRSLTLHHSHSHTGNRAASWSTIYAAEVYCTHSYIHHFFFFPSSSPHFPRHHFSSLLGIRQCCPTHARR